MSIMSTITFFRDVPVIYEDAKGDRYYGEVPFVTLNNVTGRYEEVVNNRGNAYGARHRQSYRRKRDRKVEN